jgi:subtilisin family serine protease
MRLHFKTLATSLLLSASSVYAGKVYTAPKDEAIEGSWIVVMNKNPSGAQATNLWGEDVLSTNQLASLAQTFGGKAKGYFQLAVPGMSVEMTKSDIQRLAQHPSVAYVEQDRIVKVVNTPTWGLDRIDQRDLPLDSSFSPKGDGEGVVSYIIDTGVRLTHDEFDGRAEFGINTVDNTDTDCNGHGTHVAGTVAGKTYGVAKQSKIVDVKVLACSGGGSTAGVIEGVEWAMNDFATRSETKGTANMSLGGGFSSAMNTAVGNLHDSGVVTVVAAGNSDANACNYSPASEPRVITVGSTTNTDARSSFSNYGACVDIFAPGSSITSAWIDNDTATRTISGTSMASPHVAGAVALYLNEHGDPESAENALISQASPNKITDVMGSPNLLVYTGQGPPVPTPAPTSAPTSAPCVFDTITVAIQTDNYPSETSWTLEDVCSGDSLGSGGNYVTPNKLYEDSFCGSTNDGSYTFTINDSYGDGICCSYGAGSYEVKVNGETKAQGGEFGQEETKTIGTCSPPTPPPTPAPTPAPGPPCSTDKITVIVKTDNHPQETAWFLQDKCSRKILENVSEEQYDIQSHEYVHHICAPSNGAQYSFQIFDDYGDGMCCGEGNGSYEVLLNGESVTEGGEFTTRKGKTFKSGNCSKLNRPGSVGICEDLDGSVAWRGDDYTCSTLAAMGPDMIGHYCDQVVDAQALCPRTCGLC